MNDLSNLLREWSARQEPTPAAMQELQARIVQQQTNVDQASTSGLGEARRATVAQADVGIRSTTRASGGVAVIAVAASLIAAVAMFWMNSAHDSARSFDVAAESLPTNDLVSRQSLFNELNRMFDGRWRWFGEVNGRVHLETDESSINTADRSDEQHSGVAVQLAVVQRRSGEANWRVVWEASVMARSEEWVRLPEALTGDGAVSVWAYSMPDGSVLVESDVTLTAPVPVRHSEPHVFGSSVRPARLWSTRRADGEFQLIQSIARLETHHG